MNSNEMNLQAGKTLNDVYSVQRLGRTFGYAENNFRDAEPHKWTSKTTKMLQFIADDLPERPTAKLRILKKDRTDIPYLNVVRWLITGGVINSLVDEVPFCNDAQFIDTDNCGVKHYAVRSINDVEDIDCDEPFSVWVQDVDTENFVWAGLYLTGKRKQRVVNHYNMKTGGICTHINVVLS